LQLVLLSIPQLRTRMRIGVHRFCVPRWQVLGQDVLAHGGNRVGVHQWRAVAPGVADVIDHVRYFVVVEFPAESRHGQARWLGVRCGHPRAGQHHVDHGASMVGLDRRAASQGWKDLCKAAPVRHVASRAVVHVQGLAAR